MGVVKRVFAIEQIKDFAARMKKFDIIPEYSFVLGIPLETEEAVNNQIDKDIAFIKEIKTINPDTEIIIYLYSPVPTEGSELYETVKNAGFSFPEKLEDFVGQNVAATLKKVQAKLMISNHQINYM